ncbi:MAG: hypothetical protein COA79_26410 [Planctomycetota bacterium]|nr:MAG: hypothetical protein COA79_26410 [Planctomycetota bacterium]
MIKKLLNPLIISAFVVTMLLGSLAHLMYGNFKTSKWHFMIQCYWMPENLPRWLLFKEEPIRYSYLSLFRDSPAVSVENGDVKIWYRSGKLSYSGNYKDSLKTGEHISWSLNGNMIKKVNYLNGVLNGLKEEWYHNGTKAFQGKFIKGKRVGQHIEWKKNGSKEYVSNWKNGIKNGKQEVWYGDKYHSTHFAREGDIFRSIGWFENGIEVKEEYYWNKEGTIYYIAFNDENGRTVRVEKKIENKSE